jgi:signal transduction histidine kinase
MSKRTVIQRQWLLWLLVVGLWTLVGLFESSQTFFLAALMGRPMSWEQCLSLCMADCYIWALLTPFIFLLGLRFPFDQHRWKTSLAVQVTAVLFFSFLKVLLDVPADVLLRYDLSEPRTFLGVFQVFFYARFLGNVLLCCGILGVSHALDYYRKYREREVRASQLEARLAQAQLQVLKMQLHPHFLFNTLHAISALLHLDVAVADRMIARLGELLRSALENAGTQEVSLKEELEFIKPYLEIEQARLGPRLVVHLDVDPETMDACVPNLILQPLVENAIRHGIAPHPEAGRIEIQVQREQAWLRLQVRDDGPGLSPEQQADLREGVGLSNTRARLQQLYGDAHRFDLGNAADGGLVVTLVIPFREDATDFTRPEEGPNLSSAPPAFPGAGGTAERPFPHSAGSPGQAP